MLIQGEGNPGPRLTQSPIIMKLDCEDCEVGVILGAKHIFEHFPSEYMMFEVMEPLRGGRRPCSIFCGVLDSSAMMLAPPIVLPIKNNSGSAL